MTSNQSNKMRKRITFICLIVAIGLAVEAGDGEDYAVTTDDIYCPPWTYRHHENSSCECRDNLNSKLYCYYYSNTSEYYELQVRNCFCVTYNPTTRETIAGYCPYNYNSARLELSNNNSSGTVLNQRVCGIWKRRGNLCSQCMEGYGIQLYSYKLECVQCKEFCIKDLFKFLAIAFLPLTLMLTIILLFHINILRPPWSVYILVAQVITAPPIMQGFYSAFYYLELKGGSVELAEQIVSDVYSSIFGVWNLDFFRAYINSLCISPTITNLQSAAIEGCIGLYPLTLLGFLYTLMTLHDRGYGIAIKVWRPFHWCLSRFRSKLAIKSSLIDTFATFYLLSCIKLGFAGFYILSPTRIWSPSGNVTWAVYYDPSVQYFSHTHCIYSVVTFLLTFLLLVLPFLLLVLYPFRWFQRCLNHFHLRSLALHTFVDAFQGCYKDGTNGTRDYRWFSSLQISLRLCLPLLFFLVLKQPQPALFLSVITLGVYITLFVISQPYKELLYNKSDIIMLMTLLLIFVSSVTFVPFPRNIFTIITCTICIFLGFTLTLVYGIVWIVIHIRDFIRHHRGQEILRESSLLVSPTNP